MIKSDIEIVDDVYLALTELANSIVSGKGKYLRDKRELNSTGLDIVIKLISNNIAQMQESDLSFNIYVADKLVKGQYMAETATIRTICRSVLDYFSEWNRNHSGEYDFSLSLEAQRIYEQPTNEHIISCRLKYRLLTD